MWVACFVTIVGFQKRTDLQIAGLLLKRRKIVSVENLCYGGESRVGASADVCFDPAKLATGFNMIGQTNAELTAVVEVFQTVICAILFTRIVARSEEILLRIVSVRGVDIREQVIA